MEKAILDNRIACKDSYRNKNNNLMIVCETKESRDALNEILTNSNQNISTSTPERNQTKISIVGLHREYTKEEILDMVVRQNDFVRKFAMVNNMEDHFRVLTVRPTKNAVDVFQVFASVSTILRDGIKEFKDKLSIGLTSCRVYDQYYVKRCYKCQNFGHHSRECNETEDTCAKCSGNHATNTCMSSNKKCINCVRHGSDSLNHHAFDTKCPIMMKQQDSVKSLLSKDDLNLQRYKTMEVT